MEKARSGEESEPTRAERILPLMGLEAHADTKIAAYAEAIDPHLRSLTVAGYINDPPHSEAADLYDDLLELHETSDPDYDALLRSATFITKHHIGLNG